MFDAKRLLDQVMGSMSSGNTAAPSGQSGGTSQLVTGALAGGVLGLLAGNKRVRKFAGKTAGSALKLGGLAAIAAVGYTAWQRHKGAAAPGLQLPPRDSAFAIDHQPAGPDAMARGVLVAMIQGAKADGHIDAAEQTRIFAQVEALGLDAEAKAFVMDELSAPQNMARVTAYATSPELATELYAASLLAMDPDTAAERAYLENLAQALGIDRGLAQEIETAVRNEL